MEDQCEDTDSNPVPPGTQSSVELEDAHDGSVNQYPKHGTNHISYTAG